MTDAGTGDSSGSGEFPLCPIFHISNLLELEFSLHDLSPAPLGDALELIM